MTRRPDWLILGAPKAGTTTLASWLGAHPQGYVSPVKEVSYFDLHYDRGPEWYGAHFAQASPELRAGEATPAYMYVDEALDRLSSDLPDARLVVLLREPVERIWSHYWYFRAMGIDRRRFDRILRDELADPRHAPPNIPVGYLEASRYLPRLRAIADRFPREQLAVLFFDDLRQEPQALFDDVCRHVGLGEGTPLPLGGEARNVGRVPRWAWLQWATLKGRADLLPRDVGARIRRWNLRPGSYPDMEPAVAQDLRRRFDPDNASLEEWLGRPLPASWSTG